MSENVIKDVAFRTNGEVYIGVVGSVRSGKSTFIRRFMERKVLPMINDKSTYDLVLDELPQSGDGKTIMTVEPKFVPSIELALESDGLKFNFRLVDCVGYVIPSSKGYLNDDGSVRLIKTPWDDTEISFEEAAKLGTKKVIDAHTNVGIVITSDGSFSEFSKDEYDKVLEEVVGELQNANKPFIIIYNTKNPNSEETKKAIIDIEENYGTSCIALDVENMTEDDIDKLLYDALSEFEIGNLSLDVPNWVNILDDNISFKKQYNDLVNNLGNFHKMKDAYLLQENLRNSNLFSEVLIEKIDATNGDITIDLNVDKQVYEKCIEEILGEKLDDQSKLIQILKDYSISKELLLKLKAPLKELETKGYAITTPNIMDMKLSSPVLSKQGNRYGVKIKANSDSIYMVKVDIESIFEPIIGSKEQAEALVEHMNSIDINDLWDSEIFGRKLIDVINDGIRSKVLAVPEVVLYKYKDAINKVINKTKGGVIAIVI